VQQPSLVPELAYAVEKKELEHILNALQNEGASTQVKG
jgi:hypothetical protein